MYINKAKSLLTEAGWADSNGDGTVDKVIDGEKVEMNIEVLYANGYKDYESITEIFKSDAIKAGINITPKTLDSQSYRTARNSRNFDALIAASDWYPLHRDLATRFHTRSPQNYSSFSNPEADSLMKELRGTIDETKLPAGYLRMQEIIHDEVPSIFINTGNDRLIVNKKFKNVQVSSVKPHYFLNEFTQEATVPVNSQNN